MVSETDIIELLKLAQTVLILVLVEDGLGVKGGKEPIVPNPPCLNPCFSGGWSRSATKDGDTFKVAAAVVLILVLVEDGLGEASRCWNRGQDSRS